MSDKIRKEKLKQNAIHAVSLFEKENPVVFLNEKKTLIVADIHGDLKALDFILDFAAQKKVTSFVFLGDYIDKGSNSIGVLNRLFELKMKNSKKVILLRGNHETKEVNSFYEFQNAVKDNPKLHKIVNKSFKSMPIAAILNKNIFCVHGGISGKKEESVSNISKADAFDYLWNDPSDENQITPSPRGGNAKQFGPDIAKRFLKKNNLKIMIRGHSTLEGGLRFWFEHTVVSLYSTLPYPDPNLKAAVAIVKGKEIIFYFYRKNKKQELEWENMSVSMILGNDMSHKNEL
ncbi:MAG: metallophosphoesterase family protein [Methanimicrococcus sp.]|nr:metallophosphoesterase family protein [Methanimicrococcus sp.]